MWATMALNEAYALDINNNRALPSNKNHSKNIEITKPPKPYRA
jgi:hypothetical protein